MDCARAGVLLVALALCAATSPPQYARNYPTWVIVDPQDRVVGCARAHAWVGKSGKTGLGVRVTVDPLEVGCPIAITSAKLVVPSGTIETKPVAGTHSYLPFEFDANGAWNRGERTATLTIVFSDGTAWTMQLEHRLDGYHTTRGRF